VRALNKGHGGENKQFSSFKRQYLENGRVGDTSKLLLMTNRKSHMRFRLTPRLMTLKWPWTAISSNSLGISRDRRFVKQQQLNEWK